MKLAHTHSNGSRQASASPGTLPQIEVADQKALETVVRVTDLVVAVLMLIVLAPLFAAVAIAIRADSRGSPIFRQRRCGRGYEEFTVLKFRTMECDTAVDPHRSYVLDVIAGKDEPQAENGDGGLKKLENDRRITRVGAFLRRFSMDELPQLWNVLRGDMTLVGPRPPIPYEVDFYPPRWLPRLSVKPGLTGLWQVSGRNELDYNEMVELDLEYVERRSLGLNASIIARTFAVVLSGRGAI